MWWWCYMYSIAFQTEKPTQSQVPERERESDGGGQEKRGLT